MRLKQVYYQVFYRVKNRWCNKKYNLPVPEKFGLVWQSSLCNNHSWKGSNTFVFLNLKKSFESIDWNYPEYGKLWTYNLTYFDFLNQKDSTKETGIRLIKDFLEKKPTLKDALEPYPISLRGINWVKFLSEHRIKDLDINRCLYNDYQRLRDNLEYHLLGNHLLENGFSLLFGGIYFDNANWYRKGKQILKQELQEQVLIDGAHFELSPMYHQIILHRVLDSIQLLRLNNAHPHELLDFLKTKAKEMLGWLQAVTFKNGNIPMVNDATFGIAPTTAELFAYAESLGLQSSKTVLKESGYRKMETDRYECFMDIGNIGPDYIPGHAHADAFSFELYCNQEPFIVDTGISTYEKNERRQMERGTKSHNTVLVNDTNQTEVWGGFRVARRAKIIKLVENEDGYSAQHDGYRRLGIIHKRSFSFSEQKIEIEDKLSGKSNTSKAFFHFYPYLKHITVKENTVECKQYGIEMNFNGENVEVERSTYNFAEGFNKTKEGVVVCVSFSRKLTTTIAFKSI